MMNRRTRRDFLRNCCALGAAGLATPLTRLGMVTAHAQQASDYKALVCIFLFGGNDANNTIVPMDTRYTDYSRMRGPVALGQGILRQAGTTSYGLHPSLANVQRLYGRGDAAMVFNVGTLVQPTTKREIELGTVPLPRNLYSHSDQTQQWQTSDPMGGATGWGGRINDIAATLNSSTLPSGIAVNSGNALFLSGGRTSGVNVSNSGSFGLERFGDGNAMDVRMASLQRVLTFDSGLRLVSAANGVLGQSIRTAQEINAALEGAPALPVTFPTSSLGQQLAQVAQLIAVQGSLGMTRQIFFAGLGGFDNHEDLLASHEPLMETLDSAIGAFFDTMDARSATDQVTLFTESEFNRTGDANATIGSDHAWGGHQLVFGGAVQGGTYGRFPELVLQGPDDAGDRGYWIPSVSLDQYASTLGGWFGVSDDDLRRVFPNLAQFAPQRLGFL